jgi:thiol-disulfide isomerase/thioredoxin
MRNIIVGLAAVAFAAHALLAQTPSLPRKAPELAINFPGTGPKLLSEYRGHVVALEFIETTCPHCQAASKVMSRIQNEYKSRGVQVLDAAINPNADVLVGNFAKEFQTTFPVGWVTFNQFLSFMGFTMADRVVVPQLVLIDRQGMIRYQTPPGGDANSTQESTIKQRIEELLAIKKSGSSRSRRTAAPHPAS